MILRGVIGQTNLRQQIGPARRALVLGAGNELFQVLGADSVELGQQVVANLQHRPSYFVRRVLAHLPDDEFSPHSCIGLNALRAGLGGVDQGLSLVLGLADYLLLFSAGPCGDVLLFLVGLS